MLFRQKQYDGSYFLLLLFLEQKKENDPMVYDPLKSVFRKFSVIC